MTQSKKADKGICFLLFFKSSNFKVSKQSVKHSWRSWAHKVWTSDTKQYKNDLKKKKKKKDGSNFGEVDVAPALSYRADILRQTDRQSSKGNN